MLSLEHCDERLSSASIEPEIEDEKLTELQDSFHELFQEVVTAPIDRSLRDGRKLDQWLKRFAAIINILKGVQQLHGGGAPTFLDIPSDAAPLLPGSPFLGGPDDGPRMSKVIKSCGGRRKTFVGVRYFSVALVVLCAACSGNYTPPPRPTLAPRPTPPPYPPPVRPLPDVLEKHEQGTVMRLSITVPPIPMNPQQMQRLIDRERDDSKVEVVEVLIYRRGASPGKDVPIERWDWVKGGTLLQTLYWDRR
jgi:hypothetical protein